MLQPVMVLFTLLLIRVQFVFVFREFETIILLILLLLLRVKYKQNDWLLLFQPIDFLLFFAYMRSRSGFIILSDLATMYQLGFIFHAGF